MYQSGNNSPNSTTFPIEMGTVIIADHQNVFTEDDHKDCIQIANIK